ncbi:MAG: tRNA epoxyqueuosine(34) reductase QueG [Verrucomicrobia bacterium]|nr:tRNA epoxyqueuosine(34) reductase QueG [Verrucomicrobiota bacterium]
MSHAYITESDMKQALTDFAHSLGFALCRVAPATEPPHAEHFRQWLADGCAGEMAWLERNADRRTDPQLVLPGAKSIIVLAMNYWQGERDGMEHIARYAWNHDYHDLLAPKLRELDAFLQKHGGTQRSYTDTGPVLERDFAALAGIGWHGKSTMLIHPKLGAWFFLAELLTTLEFPPDPPLADRCGQCVRCIAACPTGAITAPHRLDARRCIAYLTIELKGSIPEELRPLIGGRIYGCDACAAACPWNRFAQASQEAAFAARGAVQLSLRALLALDDTTFRTLFRGSPIARIKRRGLLRNVCVALGNTGTSADLPALERAAADPEPLLAEHARWAVEQIMTRANR